MSNLELMLARLREHGLLLQQDKRLPDIASAVAGEPIRGSWWAHPRSHAIFDCLSELEQHPDTLITKLVAGKVTFIHRRLWPAVLENRQSNCSSSPDDSIIWTARNSCSPPKPRPNVNRSYGP